MAATSASAAKLKKAGNSCGTVLLSASSGLGVLWHPFSLHKLFWGNGFSSCSWFRSLILSSVKESTDKRNYSASLWENGMVWAIFNEWMLNFRYPEMSIDYLNTSSGGSVVDYLQFMGLCFNYQINALTRKSALLGTRLHQKDRSACDVWQNV